MQVNQRKPHFIHIKLWARHCLEYSIEGIFLDSNNSAGRYSAQQRDMLLSLPGISSKNVNFLLDGFHNMNELVNAGRDKLRSVLNELGTLISRGKNLILE